jgi:hypothetical protein
MKPSITYSLLKSKGACDQQLKLFRQHFGDGPAPLDEATALSVAEIFIWDCAAVHLLRGPAIKAFCDAANLAWKAFDKAVVTAHEAALKAGRKAIEADNGMSRNEVVDLAINTREKYVNMARKKRREALAIAFLEQARNEYQ